MRRRARDGGCPDPDLDSAFSKSCVESAHKLGSSRLFVFGGVFLVIPGIVLFVFFFLLDYISTVAAFSTVSIMTLTDLSNQVWMMYFRFKAEWNESYIVLFFSFSSLLSAVSVLLLLEKWYGCLEFWMSDIFTCQKKTKAHGFGLEICVSSVVEKA